MYTDAEKAFAIENYENVYKQLKDIDLSFPRLFLMLGISCFFTGRFHESYQILTHTFSLNTIKDNDNALLLKNLIYDGKSYLRLLEKLKITTIVLPTISNESTIQSIERSNESYVEFDQFKIIMLQSGTTAGEKKISEFLNDLNIDIRSSNSEKRALASFNLAQYFISRGKEEEALLYYLDAIINDPNKALYYGFMAQTLMKLNKTNYITAIYSRRALDLDPQNARWHLIHGLVCNNLGRNFHKSFFKTSIFEFESALNYCRSDQESLRKNIKQVIDKLN